MELEVTPTPAGERSARHALPTSTTRRRPRADVVWCWSRCGRGILIGNMIERSEQLTPGELIGYLRRFLAGAVITRQEDVLLTIAGVAYAPSRLVRSPRRGAPRDQGSRRIRQSHRTGDREDHAPTQTHRQEDAEGFRLGSPVALSSSVMAMIVVVRPQLCHARTRSSAVSDRPVPAFPISRRPSAPCPAKLGLQRLDRCGERGFDHGAQVVSGR